jgi:hypothetical protein
MREERPVGFRQLVALIALAPSAAWAADFSGTWKIDNVFNGATSVITCTLEQSENALTGSCRPEISGIAASEVTGTVVGNPSPITAVKP